MRFKRRRYSSAWEAGRGELRDAEGWEVATCEASEASAMAAMAGAMQSSSLDIN